MKTAIAPTLLLLFFSFYLSAQDGDYCPCMDTENNYEMEFSSVMNNDIVAVMPQPTLTYTAEALPEPEEEMPPLPDEEEENLEDLEEEKLPKVKAEKTGKARKSRLKKRNKRFRVKRKPRKRARKYRGKCPAF